MIKKLGEIFKITSGGTPRRDNDNYFNNGNIPWVKTGDLKVKDLYKVDEFITELGLENSSAKMFPENTVLIAMYGATIGACSILRIPACTNQACAAILPNEKVIPEFLYFFLKSRQPELISKGVGGGQPNISATILKDVEIPLPDIKTQQKIAQILSEADKARQLRKTANAITDQFLQSTFLNMFGDPVGNPKGWKTETILESKCKVQIGPFGTQLHVEDYIENGIPLINPTHIQNSKIKEDNKFTITPEKFNELSNYHLLDGDIIMGRRGEMGRCALVTKREQGWLCGTGSLYIRPSNKLASIYLHFVLTSKSFKETLENEAKGVTMANLNKTIINNLLIPIPPLKLQQQFANIVNEIELLRQKQQAHEQELELLFKGLLQRYFG